MEKTQFNTLVQMIAALSARIEEIAKNQEKFATKEDLKRFATKEDLKKFATKEDLKKFATKEDLKKFVTKSDLKDELKKFATKEDIKKCATKEDLKNLATKDGLSAMADTIFEAVARPFSDLEAESRNHEARLSTLEESFWKEVKKQQSKGKLTWLKPRGSRPPNP